VVELDGPKRRFGPAKHAIIGNYVGSKVGNSKVARERGIGDPEPLRPGPVWAPTAKPGAQNDELGYRLAPAMYVATM
jgi:hypothetical protein